MHSVPSSALHPFFYTQFLLGVPRMFEVRIVNEYSKTCQIHKQIHPLPTHSHISQTYSFYWVFRAWGRVGTTIGGNKLESCGASKRSAIDQFKELYAQKTGNEWEDRKSFVKHPKKFYPIDIDYGVSLYIVL